MNFIELHLKSVFITEMIQHCRSLVNVIDHCRLKVQMNLHAVWIQSTKPVRSVVVTAIGATM